MTRAGLPPSMHPSSGECSLLFASPHPWLHPIHISISRPPAQGLRMQAGRGLKGDGAGVKWRDSARDWTKDESARLRSSRRRRRDGASSPAVVSATIPVQSARSCLGKLSSAPTHFYARSADGGSPPSE